MKDIKNMDYEELIKYEDKLDDIWDNMEAVRDDLIDQELDTTENMRYLDVMQNFVDSKRKEVLAQRRLNQEASDMQNDTNKDLENEQK